MWRLSDSDGLLKNQYATSGCFSQIGFPLIASGVSFCPRSLQILLITTATRCSSCTYVGALLNPFHQGPPVFVVPKHWTPSNLSDFWYLKKVNQDISENWSTSNFWEPFNLCNKINTNNRKTLDCNCSINLQQLCLTIRSPTPLQRWQHSVALHKKDGFRAILRWKQQNSQAFKLGSIGPLWKSGSPLKLGNNSGISGVSFIKQKSVMRNCQKYSSSLWQAWTRNRKTSPLTMRGGNGQNIHSVFRLTTLVIVFNGFRAPSAVHIV